MSTPLDEALVADALVSEPRGVEGRPACRNCEAPLVGPYCAQCGQRDAPPHPTLRELLGDAWESLTDVDGKIVSTLKLLVRPGALTCEYLLGRRARYLPPFRLYLICSVAFFLVGSIDVTREAASDGRRDAAAPDSVAQARAAGGETRATAGDSDSPFERRLERGNERLEASGREMGQVIGDNVPNAMFVIMPAYALVLMLLYRSRRVRYPAHLVFALHVHAFFFAILTGIEAVELVVDGLGLPGRIDGTVSLAGMIWTFVYFPMAMRRVYGGRWAPTILRAFVLANLYGLITLGLLSVAVIGYLYVLGG